MFFFSGYSSFYDSYSSDESMMDSDETTCSDCGDEFQNNNNLRMHKRIHLPRNEECYGCYRVFSSFSAMLIHLESGTCPSNVTCTQLDRFAFQCYQHKHYVNDWTDYCQYRCPCCDRDFRFLSAMYQHVETSPRCEWLLEVPRYLFKLRMWIAKRIRQGL